MLQAGMPEVDFLPLLLTKHLHYCLITSGGPMNIWLHKRMGINSAA
jgi:hypothetical protein